MPAHHAPQEGAAPDRIASTVRIEAFSDGVFAIVITLLILEVHVPKLTDLSVPGAWAALAHLSPKLISFAVSFFTTAMIWVNHHHFFEPITHSDWKLLWYNIGFLFWVTIVPFTTAFIGDYPTHPLAVALYAFNLCLVVLSGLWMGRYVFFHSNLFSASVGMAERRSHWSRSWIGVGLYGLAGLLAFVSVYLSLAMLALSPVFYIVPNLLRRGD